MTDPTEDQLQAAYTHDRERWIVMHTLMHGRRRGDLETLIPATRHEAHHTLDEEDPHAP
ncbi:MAG: hypothetical protein M3O70_21655 [Actinomycetota bacterium]|nr:hypothetical protein [Actinomycetota bacterium]